MKNKNETKQKHMAERTVFDLIRRAIEYLLTTKQTCIKIPIMERFKVLLRRKFLFLFPSFFNINLWYMFKIIQIAKNWNDTCVQGLEIFH